MDGVSSKGVSVRLGHGRGFSMGHMDQVCVKMTNATLVTFSGSSSCARNNQCRSDLYVKNVLHDSWHRRFNLL